jgi:hypothetical protein
LETIVEADLDLDGSDALMSNLSLGGCCIFSSRNRKMGEVVDLRFELGEGLGGVSAEGEIKWIKSLPAAEDGRKWALGILFTDISAPDLQALKTFLEEKIGQSLFDQ